MPNDPPMNEKFCDAITVLFVTFPWANIIDSVDPVLDLFSLSLSVYFFVSLNLVGQILLLVFQLTHIRYYQRVSRSVLQVKFYDVDCIGPRLSLDLYEITFRHPLHRP